MSTTHGVSQSPRTPATCEKQTSPSKYTVQSAPASADEHSNDGGVLAAARPIPLPAVAVSTAEKDIRPTSSTSGKENAELPVPTSQSQSPEAPATITGATEKVASLRAAQLTVTTSMEDTEEGSPIQLTSVFIAQAPHAAESQAPVGPGCQASAASSTKLSDTGDSKGVDTEVSHGSHNSIQETVDSKGNEVHEAIGNGGKVVKDDTQPVLDEVANEINTVKVAPMSNPQAAIKQAPAVDETSVSLASETSSVTTQNSSDDVQNTGAPAPVESLAQSNDEATSKIESHEFIVTSAPAMEINKVEQDVFTKEYDDVDEKMKHDEDVDSKA